ncbi:MAG: UMP kinase [Candidatus Thiothrix sulfatifontis]|nr:MAG: UMP kinase [Candidatus Thiothrix sulfatifontis]
MTPSVSNPAIRFRRILLKLSGEALLGNQDSGIDPEILYRVAGEALAVQRSGVQVAIVIGGGNLFRGAGLAEKGMDRVRGDQMGMLATVMNSLAMQDAIEKLGGNCRVLTALGIDQVGERYAAHQARRYLAQGDIIICAAGSGNPFFTTDTAASLRGVELQCDLLLKATKVDGIYDADPKKNPTAKRFDRLSFEDAIQRQLGVMDLTAMVMCRDNKLPLGVFDMFAPGALAAMVRGEIVGTLVEV